MDQKRIFKISFNGMTFYSEEEPYIVMGSALEKETDIEQLWITIPEEVKQYERMSYTTDLNTMNLIFSNMTLRSSSLTNAKLNDSMEKQRVGVEQFAGSRYITCFSHLEREGIPFWMYYGGDEKNKKVLLQFKNFAPSFEKCIYTDYCLIDGDKKVFFYSDEYKRTLQHNSRLGQLRGLHQINTEYDIRNCVRSIDVFDIDYLPSNATEFSQDYSSKEDIKFNESEESSVMTGITVYRPDCLGKQKSNPWANEEESRILCCLDHQEFTEWKYIDLRLKEEFFRDLIVVMNPWAEPELKQEIENIIAASPLSKEIKETIIVKHSAVEGTVNL